MSRVREMAAETKRNGEANGVAQAVGQGNAKSNEDGKPRSAIIASKGIRTGTEFAGLMSALMADVISGAVSPGVCNAAVNAGGKLLKVVDMQHKYGTLGGAGDKRLNLCADESKDDRLARIQKEIEDLRG